MRSTIHGGEALKWILGLLYSAVVAALILRRLARTAGREVVQEHWRGDRAIIERVLRVV